MGAGLCFRVCVVPITYHESFPFILVPSMSCIVACTAFKPLKSPPESSKLLAQAAMTVFPRNLGRANPTKYRPSRALQQEDEEVDILFGILYSSLPQDDHCFNGSSPLALEGSNSSKDMIQEEQMMQEAGRNCKANLHSSANLHSNKGDRFNLPAQRVK